VRLLPSVLFWVSIALIFYAYLGYPVLLKIVSFFRNRPVKKGDVSPKVSFIIAAYNEENCIGEKIENTLAQDYPREKLETIVVSDCSTDRTDERVRFYESKGVLLIRAPQRKGKEAAQKIAVERASGQIIVFSDVATLLEPRGISSIVRNFNDPTVGCVSSVDRFVDRDGKTSGEGAYVRYEMLLRSLETKVNTLVGLSGSFFAARREVCRDWAIDLQSDFNTLLNSVKTGLRGVSDPESIGYYRDISDEEKEFERKVRTVLRGISVFMRGLPLLNPFKYGLFSWQLFSHKLCRWMVPFALVVTFVSNLVLAPYSVFYLWTLILQLVFYAFAFGGVWMTPFSRKYFLKIPSFFVLVNLSILMAWYRYFQGERQLAWEPSQR
jgi:glycosyltransferase involved in cell wall biosynthesis